MFYQQARTCIRANIAGAWRGVGLHPYNPNKVLNEFEPIQSEPGDESEGTTQHRRFHVHDKVTPDQLAVCPTPVRKNYALYRSYNQALVILNQGLVQKQRETKPKKTTGKSFGTAKRLSVGAMEREITRKNTANQLLLKEKARKAALRGKVGFAKLVWKEMPVDYDIFSSQSEETAEI